VSVSERSSALFGTVVCYVYVDGMHADPETTMSFRQSVRYVWGRRIQVGRWTRSFRAVFPVLALPPTSLYARRAPQWYGARAQAQFGPSRTFTWRWTACGDS
jgi:hypothetical protein